MKFSNQAMKRIAQNFFSKKENETFLAELLYLKSMVDNAYKYYWELYEIKDEVQVGFEEEVEHFIEMLDEIIRQATSLKE